VLQTKYRECSNTKKKIIFYLFFFFLADNVSRNIVLGKIDFLTFLKQNVSYVNVCYVQLELEYDFFNPTFTGLAFISYDTDISVSLRTDDCVFRDESSKSFFQTVNVIINFFLNTFYKLN